MCFHWLVKIVAVINYVGEDDVKLMVIIVLLAVTCKNNGMFCRIAKNGKERYIRTKIIIIISV